jgi:hypothetical protein
MKLQSTFRFLSIAAALAVFLIPARAQKIETAYLDRLAARASETVDINMDEKLIKLGAKFLGNDPDDAKIKEVVNSLKGIYVKSFTFENAGEYQAADVESLRSQLNSAGWSRIVGVTSKKDGENVEVYLMTVGGQIGGLAILSFEPKELTVVNIVGPVDLDKLSKLEGEFGIPDIQIQREDKP